MMLHRHFEALKEKAQPKQGMEVKEGEDMLTEAKAEEREQPKRARKRKTE